MRAYALAAMLLIPASFACSVAVAEPPAAASQAKYSTAETDIGTLLDDPAARAIVDKHIPGFSSGDQIDMARSMTLKAIQPFAADTITDQALKAIDSELAALAKKK